MERKAKRELSKFTEASTIIVEVLLLGFVLFLLFSRIQSILDYASRYHSSFWDALSMDIATNPIVWIIFGVVFLLWMAMKAIQRNQDDAQRKDIMNKLDDIVKEIKALRDDLQKEGKNDHPK